MRSSQGQDEDRAAPPPPPPMSGGGEAADRRGGWPVAQAAAFQAAMNGEPLARALGFMTDAANAEADDGRCSAFYLADPEGRRLYHVVGMPADYAAAIDGAAISPASPACGSAVANGVPEITRDVEEDPRWRPRIDLARAHGIRGCWSFPIETATGRLVGSFAQYLPRPRDPKARDLAFAAAVTRTAAIIISRHQQNEEHHRIEAALRAAETRQAFLLELSDALRPLADGAEIERVAVRLLGERLGADRVFYASVDGDVGYWSYRWAYNKGLPIEPGRFAFAAYQLKRLPQWQSGQMSSVADSETDPGLDADDRASYAAFGSRAAIGVPLVKHGRFTALLVVNQARPRDWTEAELTLTREAAERTWEAMERARAETALRESEARQAFLLELSDAMRASLDAEAVIAAGAGMLGRALDASRIVFAEIDDLAGLARIREGWTATGAQMHPASLRLADFGGPLLDDLRAGRSVRFDDVGEPPYERGDQAALAAIGVRAGLSVPLLAGGRLVVNLNVHQHTPRRWTDAEVALVEAVAERLWAAVERARAETALRGSEEKYRTLFESIDEGFVLLELLQDAAGRTVDFRYLEMNRAFELQSGLVDAVGRLASEAAPGLEESWYATYDRVRRTGIAERFERHSVVTDRWYAVYAARVGQAGSPRICAVFADISERKRAEANGALLAGVADDLNRLTAPDEIIDAVGARMGEALDLNSCLFVDVDEERGELTVHHAWQEEGAPNLRQRFRIADFVTAEFARSQRAGETLVVRDTVADARTDADAYARLSIRAILAVPFHHEGRWVAYLTVTDAAPRDWRPDEIAAVQGIAERVFPRIERARAEEALRESEARQAFLLELSDALRPLGDPTAIQATAMRVLGAKLGANRAFYGAAQPDGDTLVIGPGYSHEASSLEGHVSFSAFDVDMAGWYRSGRTYVIDDTTADDRNGAVTKAQFARIDVGAAIGVPLVKDGLIRAIVSVHQSTPRRWSEAEIALVEEVAERTWAAVVRASAEAALRESEEQQRLLIALVPALLWWADARGDSVTLNHSWCSYTGRSWDGAQAFGWLEAIHPDDIDATRGAFDHAFATGEPLEWQQRIRKAGEGYRWHLVRHVPLRADDGRITRWFGAAIDIHDLHELQQHQRLLVAELQHRVRNILTVIRLTFARTFDQGDDPDDMARHFRGRLDAMARTQVLLSRTASRSAQLEDLIRDELLSVGATEESGVTLGGPEVALDGKVAESIGMALHELTTNALKYGALRVPNGQLDVRWNIHIGEGGRRTLSLTWQEAGVPAVSVHPSREGFGRELIEEALPYRIKAETSLVFEGGGVRCSISVPLTDRPEGSAAGGDAR